jgi:hypothetical protein
MPPTAFALIVPAATMVQRLREKCEEGRLSFWLPTQRLSWASETFSEKGNDIAVADEGRGSVKTSCTGRHPERDCLCMVLLSPESRPLVIAYYRIIGTVMQDEFAFLLVNFDLSCGLRLP